MDGAGPTPAERIRVLLLLPSLHGGGAERVAVHILNHADRSAFDVRMGLLRRFGPYLSEIDPALVDASPIGERHLDFDRGNAEAYRAGSLALGVVLTPVNVIAMIRKFRPHVVVSFRKGMSVITWGALLLRGRRGVRWIAREGNNTLAVIEDELASPLARAAVRRLTARCYGSADVLLTISHEMADGIARDLGLPRERMRTVHNAVDIAEVRRRAAEPAPVPEGPPYLVAVGRLERQKGFDVLLDAFAASGARETHRLIILGEGSDGEDLRARVTALGLDGRVLMPGWDDNPWAWMKGADAFVLSSRWEGFGNVVIEAMACGLPVVVTDCDFGPKEIVRHGESGLVVPTGEVGPLREAIDRVVSDRALRDRLASAAARRAEDFDVAVSVRRYEELFREVASDLTSLTPAATERRPKSRSVDAPSSSPESGR